MTRLLIITRYYPPVNNGLSHHTKLMVHLLSSHFDIDLVCEGGRARNGEHETADGRLRLFEYEGIRDLFRVVSRLCSSASAKPDIVFFQYVPHMWGRAGLAPVLTLLPLWIRLRYQIEVVSFLHELYVDFNRNPKQCMIALIHRLQLLAIGCASQKLVVTNEKRQRVLNTLWKRKLYRIAAGNTSGRKDEELRQMWAAFPYITWYGTLSEDQRLDSLVRSFVGLAQEFPELRLVLVGAFNINDESIRRLLEYAGTEQVRGRILVKGFTEDNELSDILSGSAANVFIAGSGPSGRRTVMAAYLRSGRPVVSITGYETDPEYVHGHNIMLVPDQNADKLREVLKEVLMDESLRVKLESGGYQLFHDAYSDHALSRQMIQMLSVKSNNEVTL